jgi:hypothetical protein
MMIWENLEVEFEKDIAPYTDVSAKVTDRLLENPV